MISLLLFTAVVGVLLWSFLRWMIRYIHLVKTLKLRTPAWLPFLGNAHLLKPTPAEVYGQFLSFAKEFEKEGVHIIWIGTTPNVVVHQAELMEPLMNSTKHIEKSFHYDMVHQWLGTGLLTSSGAKWKSRRKMLTPTFHFQILNDFQDVICEQTKILATKLTEMADTNEPFNLFPYMAHCALDIICETAMGESIKAQVQRDSDYVRAIYRISEIIAVRSRTPVQWPELLFRCFSVGREHDRLLKIMHGFTQSVIKKKLAELKAAVPQEETTTKKKRKAFLDLLLHESKEMGGTLTMDDIREEVDTFMFEGHDTTASASSWVCYLIGGHPAVQQKLHEEMDGIFGDSDRHATSDDLKEMTYLDCVIKESLRLFPSVPFIGRVTSDPLNLGGSEIPVGTQVLLFIHALHLDERFFPEPYKFEPDRFLQDEASNRHPFSYLPFSAGPRNCIGQKFAMLELKLELSFLMRKFRLQSMQKYNELSVEGNLVLRPEKGIIVKLYRRKA